MFSLLRKMFAKKAAAPAVVPVTEAAPVRTPRVVAGAPVAAAPAAPAKPQMAAAQPQVAVAQLSLAAIIAKFPEDLRKHVQTVPDASATVALPLATIHKQLAAGAVKMSLASLYRQAPRGTFKEAKSEEKRMVEVPLSEVMRHVDVAALRRRGDQRRVELPKGAPQLFGDRKNPFAVRPTFIEDEEESEVAAEEADEAEEETSLEIPPLRMTMPAAAPASPAPAAAPAPISETLSLPLAALGTAWPEPIRSEAAAHGEAQVALPTALVGPGLSKGKVSVTWGQIRSWMTPPPANGTKGYEATELLLPLKVVAPAFMALSKPAARRRSLEVDESIPALFGGAAPAPAPVEEAPAPEPQAAAPAPAAAPALKFVLREEGPAEPEPVAPTEPEPAAAPQSLGELFGTPERKEWPAQELVQRTAKLPGIAGAVLALHEGLPVAASLPPEIKSETMAAFLPQMFARLSNYTGEMKLGEVEDILLTVNGAHFQVYRIGQVYFAVLARSGCALPWEALRLVVQELVAQAPA